MADVERLPRDLRTFIRMYAWQRNEPVPWAEPRTALSNSRVGLIVTACMAMGDQPPFEATEPDFDPSIRVVPSGTDPRELVNTYPEQAFDHAGLKADPNLLVPLDRLREMSASGEIGGITDRTVSMCGHLPKPRRLVADSAPDIARLFAEDGADVVLLVPA